MKTCSIYDAIYFVFFCVFCWINSLSPECWALQRPVTRSFDVFFDLRLNKRLSKQSRRRWFEMSSHSSWSHCIEKLSKLINIIDVIALKFIVCNVATILSSGRWVKTTDTVKVSKSKRACFIIETIHYNVVILSTMASLITGVPIVYSTVCSGEDQRNHQSSVSLAFVWGIHR